MTRIIAGDFKGRTLKVPPSVTRPTSSRVREAMFSSLEHAHGGLEDMRVLDLFAGSGALAIESLSRGAAYAELMENDSKAVATIKDNLKSLGVAAHVVGGDLFAHLASGTPAQGFGVVFADPPYGIADERMTHLLELLRDGKWLNDDAVVVVERDKRSTCEWPEGFGDIEQRSYGDTVVWYGHFIGSEVEKS